MFISRSSRALIAASLLIGSLWNPIRADASRWQQYLQKGANIVRQGIQLRNSASGGGYDSGGGGGYHQAPPQQAPDSSGAPNSPGSNYYNIDANTMRNPLRRAQPEPPPEQPSYTPPPSYQRPSYSSRSAYHTGSDAGSEPQQVNVRMPIYVPARRPVHSHAVVKRVDRPEKAAVAVQPPTKATPIFFEKPDVIKPATTFDTSWIMPAVDRMEMKVRKGST